MAQVTCHTDGCANAGITIDCQISWVDGEGVHHVDAVVCGVCGETISDVKTIGEN
jgi:hypothetical protein